jgi:hypothetical protein
VSMGVPFVPISQKAVKILPSKEGTKVPNSRGYITGKSSVSSKPAMGRQKSILAFATTMQCSSK